MSRDRRLATNLTPDDPTNNPACPGTATAQMVNVADIEAFGPSAVTAGPAPTPTLPQAGTAAALPLAGLFLLGAVAYRRRRRQQARGRLQHARRAGRLAVPGGGAATARP